MIALEDIYVECWEQNAVRYAVSREPAETVVLAAQAACETERAAYRARAYIAMREQFGDAMVETLDHWEDRRRRGIVRRVLEERLKD